MQDSNLAKLASKQQRSYISYWFASYIEYASDVSLLLVRAATEP